MKKTLIAFYSRTGSNKYLAEKLAQSLNCDIEEIKPRNNKFFFLLVSTWIKVSMGIRAFKNNPVDYDTVILCGPIWMGQLITPLRCFIKRYKGKISELHFITSCGSSDEKKTDKFGHAHVFEKVKQLAGSKLKQCEAFPIPLVVPEDKLEDEQAIMNTRLSDDNFKGEIQERFNALIVEINKVD